MKVKLTIVYEADYDNIKELEAFVEQKDEQAIFEIFGVGWDPPSSIVVEGVEP